MSISIRIRIAATLLMLSLVLMIGRAFAQGPNLLENGGFEAGFEAIGVANGWRYFHTDDVAVGFSDDSWEPVVIEGEHAQSIELTRANVADSYAGIFQNVAVQPGQKYELSLKGLIRSDEGNIETSNYGYRLSYAIDLTGNEDWRRVTKWVELPWDEQPRGNNTFEFDSLKTSFTVEGDSATIFIRAWKKWADIQGANYNLDAIRLVAMDSGSSAVSSTVAQTDTTESMDVSVAVTDAVTDTVTSESEADAEEETEINQSLPETGQDATGNVTVMILSALLILFMVGTALFKWKTATNREINDGVDV